MNKLIPLTALVALALGVWAYVSINGASRSLDAAAFSAVTVLPAGRALPEIDFVDHNGDVVGPDVFRGKWTVLFMGFTNCGHLCPMTLAQVRMAVDGAQHPVDVVFFSVDPGRDTPAVMRDYVKGFDEKFIGMSASAAGIDKLSVALGAPYFVDPSPDNYTVDHSSALFLISPDAELRGTITQPFDVVRMATEFDQLPLLVGS